MAKSVKIISTQWCPYCVRAKNLLKNLGVKFTEIDVTENEELRSQYAQISGMRTVPMIFVEEELLGGCDDLEELEESGQLKSKLGI